LGVGNAPRVSSTRRVGRGGGGRPGPGRRPTSKGDRRLRRWLLIGLGVAAAGVVAFLLVPRGGVAPDVRVAGVDLGTSEGSAKAALVARARGLLARPIDVRADGRLVTVLRLSDLDARPLVGRALAEARNHSPGALSRAWRVASRPGPVESPLPVSYGSGRLSEWIASLAGSVDRPARSARAVVRGTQVMVTPASGGRLLDRARLRELMTADLAALPRVLDLPLYDEDPRVETDQVQRAARDARDILARPATIQVGGRDRLLGTAAVARALRFPDGRAEIDADALRGPLHSLYRGIDRLPVAARFVTDGEHARVAPSRPGRQVDVDAVARGLEGSDRPVDADLLTVAPSLTTAQARAMGIRELVGGFTTPLTPGEPRTTNITRGAQILNGTIVPSGKTLSLNAVLGKRTEARGFVTAPMIADSLLVEATGGGVSQIAATLYNAAFFAGLDLLQHTAHELYIWRYPPGREATISWGGPDLVVRNEWPHAMLVRAASDGSRLTVNIYSSKDGRRVETETSQPFAQTPPPTRRILNEDLPPKSKITTQAGEKGFSVDVTRRVYRGDRLVRDETFRTTYQPYPKIESVGPAVPGAEPPPEAPPG
jgi:vancomycin resistance protein YoaR